MSPRPLLILAFLILGGCADYQRTYSVSYSDGKSTISAGIRSK